MGLVVTLTLLWFGLANDCQPSMKPLWAEVHVDAVTRTIAQWYRMYYR